MSIIDHLLSTLYSREYWMSKIGTFLQLGRIHPNILYIQSHLSSITYNLLIQLSINYIGDHSNNSLLYINTFQFIQLTWSCSFSHIKSIFVHFNHTPYIQVMVLNIIHILFIKGRTLFYIHIDFTKIKSYLLSCTQCMFYCQYIKNNQLWVIDILDN